MRSFRVGPVALAAILAAGCSSPAAPSSTTSTISTADAQTVVGASVSQAVTQGNTLGTPGGTGSTITIACQQGGSIVSTMLTPRLQLADLVAGSGTASIKTEFNNCRSQMITINGDPYLTHTYQFTFTEGPNGANASFAGTTRTTGGLRFDVISTGIQGRAQYDCTVTASLHYEGTTPVASFTSSGTITWEQPLGTVTTKACGPS